ncbi:MAG: glutathione S-transferase N-terminal domain-containing protein [Myxococcales bacterium]|nr:glutathione S-transferase N-terminal domain-containing protein [Myxococcales bacterium]
MKLFGHPASTCTRKVLFTLAEKGIAHEFNIVDITKGEQKQPAHLARQPFGVVPAIEDGDFKMYESRAIIRYLDAKHGGASLTPTGLQDRARMDQWISVEQSYFSPTAMKAVMEIWYSSMQGREADKSVIQAGLEGTKRSLDVLDAALAGNEYLVGAFSLADVCFAPYLQYLQDMGIDGNVKERANVSAWWSRVSGRSAWQKAIGKG